MCFRKSLTARGIAVVLSVSLASGPVLAETARLSGQQSGVRSNSAVHPVSLQSVQFVPGPAPIGAKFSAGSSLISFGASSALVAISNSGIAPIQLAGLGGGGLQPEVVNVSIGGSPAFVGTTEPRLNAAAVPVGPLKSVSFGQEYNLWGHASDRGIGGIFFFRFKSNGYSSMAMAHAIARSLGGSGLSRPELLSKSHQGDLPATAGFSAGFSRVGGWTDSGRLASPTDNVLHVSRGTSPLSPLSAGSGGSNPSVLMEGTIRPQNEAKRPSKSLASGRRGVLHGLVAPLALSFILALHPMGNVSVADETVQFIPEIYSDFRAELAAGRVSYVEIHGYDIFYKDKFGLNHQTYAPEDPGLIDAILRPGLRYQGRGIDGKEAASPQEGDAFRPKAHLRIGPPLPSSSVWLQLFNSWGPFLFAGWIYWRYLKSNLSGGWRFRPRLILPGGIRFSFDDLPGNEGAVAELREILHAFLYPERLSVTGGRVPSGALLVGESGTGKTLLARAMAGEAGVPLIEVSGSELTEMWVGLGASRIRYIFAVARKRAPCIIFIDHLDAFGRTREPSRPGDSGGQDREQTLNQLLVEMDGMGSTPGVLVLAATSRPEAIDPALMRRFGRQVVLEKPDETGRLAILKALTAGMPLEDSSDLKVLAGLANGFSPAQLSGLVNEASLAATRKNKMAIGFDDFQEALGHMLFGRRRGVEQWAEEQIERAAHYYVGQVLLMLSTGMGVSQVSIGPRENGLGSIVAFGDSRIMTLERMRQRIVILLAGRAAESIAFHGNPSTMAAADMREATVLAVELVARLGASPVLGPVAYLDSGRSIYGPRVSEETRAEIDSEVSSLIHAAMGEAMSFLMSNIITLHMVASALSKEKTLNGARLGDLIAMGSFLDFITDIPLMITIAPSREDLGEEGPQ